MLEELKEENRVLRIEVEGFKKEIEDYQCPDCDEISPLVLEFDTEEDFSEFLKEVEEE